MAVAWEGRGDGSGPRTGERAVGLRVVDVAEGARGRRASTRNRSLLILPDVGRVASSSGRQAGVRVCWRTSTNGPAAAQIDCQSVSQRGDDVIVEPTRPGPPG